MKHKSRPHLIIDESFRNLICPLSRQEYLQLEENLLSDGCRNPIVIWNGVIIDGHNRYDICRKHGIPFRVVRQIKRCTFRQIIRCDFAAQLRCLGTLLDAETALCFHK